MSAPLSIFPVAHPIRGTIRPPGSKSITNRALVIAALADGESRLSGVLDSQDTRVMVESLRRLDIDVRHDRDACMAIVTGCGGRIPASGAELYLENSGTSIRFLTALCTLGHGTYRLDGNARMRERPIRDLVDALRQLGADVRTETESGCPPVVVNGRGLPGGRASVAGNISSQYLSALLMAAPGAGVVDPGKAGETASDTGAPDAGRGAGCAVELRLSGELVSEPYVAMTVGVMRSFGVDVETKATSEGHTLYRVPRAAYRAAQYAIEPDASAASYFLAAAAITGGEVTIPVLSRNALQGDVGFAAILARMGCRVTWGADSITLAGGPLRGVDVDMNAVSDTAQTLAAVAVFAEGPTRIRNVAHMRHKETDRIAALATELRRIGQTVEEHPDGLTIHPAPIRPATIETYDDHRMAMSFAIVGLRAEGIRISNPECTEKTYPAFFDDLQQLCEGWGNESPAKGTQNASQGGS